MQAVARKIDTNSGVTEDFGTVTSSEGGEFAVRTEGGLMVVARRALSCLVAPEVDDRVLVAVGGRARECFILAVLEREARATVELTVEGDLALRASHGAVTVSAAHDVNLLAQAEVNIASRGVSVQANEGTLALRAVNLVGELLRADVREVKAVAETVDTVVERLSQRVKRAFRFIEEDDVKRAERIDHAARQVMHLRAENALVTAHKLAKVDGEQIHIG